MVPKHDLSRESDDALRRICGRLLRIQETALHLQFPGPRGNLPVPPLNPSLDEDPLLLPMLEQAARFNTQNRAKALHLEQDVQDHLKRIDLWRDTAQKGGDAEDMFWAMNSADSASVFTVLPNTRQRNLPLAVQSEMDTARKKHQQTLRAVHEARTWTSAEREHLVAAMQGWVDAMKNCEKAKQHWLIAHFHTILPPSSDPLILSIEEELPAVTHTLTLQSLAQQAPERLTPLGLLDIQQAFNDWAQVYIESRERQIRRLMAGWREEESIPPGTLERIAELEPPLKALRAALQTEGLSFYCTPPSSLRL